ncbi:hydantoinase/oxoprolinase family protein [Acerihabitans sp.]|uniref:hydantoinase/oxoprolinase family protein n=1 Tax=Acerihabitans sp. TaxID=2811394 RepID=UPI002ED89E27
MSGLLAAVDVGGTFIDVVVTNPATGETRIAKVLHRKGDQGNDILAALGGLARQMNAGAADIDAAVVGTTVVTNALLEGALAKTALLTTAGFRDVLEIARMTRPSSYDLHARRAPVVAPRHLRLEVPERRDHHGEVLLPLDEAALDRCIEQLREEKVEAVAVSLLFSFVNPEHERRIREKLAVLGVPVSLSSDVLPVFREYERTTATVLNAATMPVMAQFLSGLQTLKDQGPAKAFIMGSAGGCLTFAEARRFPIKCAMSGPAGGAVGALDLCARHGLGEALTLDIGGTSSDIALLRNGAIPVTDERAIGGYPVAVASAEIETIGAGGGSIAYLDRAGSLKVGPRSAGSTPGPASYGRGGELPTVTDAHVALNRLGVDSMLGGEFPLDREAAVAAIERHIAAPLGVSWQRAAHGILQITTANIVRAIRAMSVERGHDPRGMTLIAFGGAGPLHAVEVARSLAIPRVLIPYFSGVFSAHGILSVDIAYDAQRTWLRELSVINARELAELARDMTGALLARAAEDGFSADDLVIAWSADLRYRGQSHALTVALPSPDAAGLAASRSTFLAEHMLRYGHASATAAVELLNLRLKISRPRTGAGEVGAASANAGAPAGQRDIWLDDAECVVCPVYQRAALPDRWRATGPLVIEQFDAVTVLGHGDVAEVLPGTRALSIRIHPHTV